MLIKPEEKADQPIPDGETSQSGSAGLEQRGKAVEGGRKLSLSQEGPLATLPTQPLPGISRPTVAPRADLTAHRTYHQYWLTREPGPRHCWAHRPPVSRAPLLSLGGHPLLGRGRRPPGNVRGALGDELVQVMLDHLLSLEARDTSVPQSRPGSRPILGVTCHWLPPQPNTWLQSSWNQQGQMEKCWAR